MQGEDNKKRGGRGQGAAFNKLLKMTESVH